MTTSQQRSDIITRPEDTPALKRFFEDMIIAIWYDIDHRDAAGGVAVLLSRTRSC